MIACRTSHCFLLTFKFKEVVTLFLDLAGLCTDKCTLQWVI